MECRGVCSNADLTGDRRWPLYPLQPLFYSLPSVVDGQGWIPPQFRTQPGSVQVRSKRTLIQGHTGCQRKSQAACLLGGSLPRRPRWASGDYQPSPATHTLWLSTEATESKHFPPDLGWAWCPWGSPWGPGFQINSKQASHPTHPNSVVFFLSPPPPPGPWGPTSCKGVSWGAGSVYPSARQGFRLGPVGHTEPSSSALCSLPRGERLDRNDCFLFLGSVSLWKLRPN